MTAELIERLAQDLKPVPSNALLKVLGIALAFGLVTSTIAMMLWLGPRPDLFKAFGTPIFWIKFVYTLALGCCGAWAASRVARPGENGRLPLAIVCLIVLSVAIAAGISYVTAPPQERHAIVMGSSALVCPHYVIALSMPLLIAAIVFMRHGADKPNARRAIGGTDGRCARSLGILVPLHGSGAAVPHPLVQPGHCRRGAGWHGCGAAILPLVRLPSYRLTPARSAGTFATMVTPCNVDLTAQNRTAVAQPYICPQPNVEGATPGFNFSCVRQACKFIMVSGKP